MQLEVAERDDDRMITSSASAMDGTIIIFLNIEAIDGVPIALLSLIASMRDFRARNALSAALTVPAALRFVLAALATLDASESTSARESMWTRRAARRGGG